MEIEVVENKKNRLKIKVHGGDHTLCNSLKKELWNDKNIKISGYNIEHPLVSSPEMVIETDSSGDPKKALQDAIKRIKKQNEDLRKKITKEIK